MMNSNFDLVIIGGGPAGIGAGVTATKEGLKTLIIHKDQEIGGQATNIYVGTICGVHRRFNKEDNLVGNFPREFTRKLASLSNTSVVSNETGLSYLPYKLEAFKELSDKYLKNNLLQIRNQYEVIKTHTENYQIKTINITKGDNTETISASAFIDCSGNGILTNLGGGEMINESDYQFPSLVLALSGIKEKDENILKLTLFKELESAYRNNLISANGRSLNFVPGTTNTYQDKVYFKFNNQSPNSSYEEESNKLKEVLRYLKTTSFFANIKLEFLSTCLGIRSSQRPRGIYTLTDSMVLNAEESDNTIAKGIWPIELWKGPKAPIIEYIKNDDYYDIPYDCLVSKSFKNLLSAGRAISAEEKAHSSARVIGTALQTGHAAGFLATSIIDNSDILGCVHKYQQLEELR